MVRYQAVVRLVKDGQKAPDYYLLKIGKLNVRFYYKTHKSADDALWLAHSVLELCCIKNHKFSQRTVLINGDPIYEESFARNVKEAIYNCDGREKSLFVKAPIRAVREIFGKTRDATIPQDLPIIPREWVASVYENSDEVVVDQIYSWANEILKSIQSKHGLEEKQSFLDEGVSNSYYECKYFFTGRRQRWYFLKNIRKPASPQ